MPEVLHDERSPTDTPRAFILRRVELIARGFSDVVLIGSNHSAAALRIKELLTRNGHPCTSIDLDRDAGAQDLLDRYHVTVKFVHEVLAE